MRSGVSDEGDDVKRRLVTIAVFLLAGAVVNVAVAWGCARWSTVEGSPSEKIQYEPYGTRSDHAYGGFGLRLTLVYSEELHHYYVHLDVESGWPFVALSRSEWHSYEVRLPPDPEVYSEVIEFLRSLPEKGEPHPFWAKFFTPEYKDVGLFIDSLWDRVFEAHNQSTSTPRDITLATPIWPGLAINTFIYATLLWLLVCGPFVLRRFVRVRRGLCPKCAYPMGERGVCSECGAPCLVAPGPIQRAPASLGRFAGNSAPIKPSHGSWGGEVVECEKP